MLREIDLQLTWLWGKPLRWLERISKKDNFYLTKILYYVVILTSVAGIFLSGDTTLAFLSFVALFTAANFLTKLGGLQQAVSKGETPPISVIFTHPTQYQGRFMMALGAFVCLSFVPYTPRAWITVAIWTMNHIAFYWAVDYTIDKSLRPAKR